MSDQPFIVGFATTNRHKLVETEAVLVALCPGIRLVAVPPAQDVEETGTTFEANARLKLEVALAGSLPDEVDAVIAEDAGLVVPALAGCYGLDPFPGVYSHRWFNGEVQRALLGEVVENPDYSRINQGLLALMAGKTDRAARYEAWVAGWLRVTGEIAIATGAMDLAVAEAPAGEHGFGYDPIMICPAYDPGRTVAQLSADEKNRISHRFQALLRLVRQWVPAAAPRAASGCSAQCAPSGPESE